MKKMTEWEWLKKNINDLINVTKKVSSIEKEIIYDKTKPCSILKLIGLMLYLKFYSKVAPKYFPRTYYVDILADSGLNRIHKDVIAGSPIIASQFVHNKFDKFLMIDNNKEYLKALDARLNAIGTSHTIFPGDCNTEIDRLIKEINRKSHFLAFIDNQGMDAQWETVEKLLELNGDIIINYQTQEFARVCGVTRPKTQETCTIFFGDDGWKGKNKQELLDYYIQKIRKHRPNTMNITIASKSGGFHYDLIFAVANTRGGSPWFKPVVGHIKEKLEKNTGQNIKTALDVLSGRITNLEDLDIFK